MKRFVADTGPLLHLHEVGGWALLSGMGEIETTPVVVAEIKRLVPTLGKANWPEWLQVANPAAAVKSTARVWIQAGILDAGEAEALAHARETKAVGFLTDDAEAREMAVALNLEVRGSLGVVLMAAARGQLEQAKAEALLQRLEQGSSLWISTKVRKAAREALMQIYQP